jgi:cellulose synthase/poly-beta-1,6-N-acetylglucosamine synthase-like glycosyltransferase
VNASIVIPCKNGEYTLDMCLKSIADLDYPSGFELILVDDGSTDRTPEIMRRFKEKHPRIETTILKGDGILGAGNAINIGWRKAKSELIAITNADCVVFKDWLMEILKPFEYPLVGGATGNVLTPDGMNLLQRLIGYELEYRYSKYLEYVMSPQDSNLAYRKKVLEEVDGYDPQFKTGYDVDIGYRVNKAGYKIKFNPDAKVWHYHRADLKSYWNQQKQTSKTRFQILMKHPHGIKGDNLANPTLMTTPPLVWTLILGLTPTMMIPAFTTPYILLLLFYLSLMLQYTLRIYMKFPKAETLLLFPLMIYRSLALGWGMIEGVLLVLKRKAFSR